MTSTPPAAASTGFQNGLAIAGDMMSAASFLGISAHDVPQRLRRPALLRWASWPAGPIILFLIAERLRNLGKYTFADVASYRLDQTPDPLDCRPSAR